MKFFIPAFLLFFLGYMCQAASHRADSSHYRKHIKYVYKEHRKLCKHLKAVCNKTYSDTLIHFKYRCVANSYGQSTSAFSYLKNRNHRTAPLARQFSESETHLGIIEETYKKLDHHSSDASKRLVQKGALKEAGKLQQTSFYGSGKYRYFKKNHASGILSKISKGKINVAKASQQFVSPVTKAVSDSKGALSAAKAKIKLPENLQTVSGSSKAFVNDQPSEGPSKQEKFQKALAGPVISMPDSNETKDSMLFKPNPYRLMPFSARIKPGGNFETGKLSPAYRKMSYTGNITYLLSPRIKPVLGLGFEHSIGVSNNKLITEYVSFTIKAGAEWRVYKAFSLFGNVETYSYAAKFNSENLLPKRDFVIGITNDTGKKTRLKIWAGFKLHALASRHENPFVFRIGL